MVRRRYAGRVWRVLNGLPAALPRVRPLRPDAADDEVRRVLAVLDRHRRRLVPWAAAAAARGAPATRRRLTIEDELHLTEGLIDALMCHWVGPDWPDEVARWARGEPRRARWLGLAALRPAIRGDRAWREYNERVQAAQGRP